MNPAPPVMRIFVGLSLPSAQKRCILSCPCQTGSTRHRLLRLSLRSFLSAQGPFPCSSRGSLPERQRQRLSAFPLRVLSWCEGHAAQLWLLLRGVSSSP